MSDIIKIKLGFENLEKVEFEPDEFVVFRMKDLMDEVEDGATVD